MRTQPAGLGSQSDRGGAVECVFRFLPRVRGGWLTPSLHALRNWRRWMLFRTPDSAWSAEFFFFACMQATKHCQSSICPSKIWRRGQASCDEPVQFRSRRGDPLQIALFGILNVRRHSIDCT